MTKVDTTPNSTLSSVTAPDWTTRTSFTEAGRLVFVVSGPASKDLQPLVYKAMKAQFERRSFSQDSGALKSAETYLDSLSRTVPESTWKQKGTVWWKVSVGQGDWDAARARFSEKKQNSHGDPSVSLEQKAESLLAEARYADAITEYVNAAVAAMQAEPKPLTQRYDSLVGKAQDILSQFTLTTTTPKQSAMVGKAFDQPFQAQLTYGAAKGGVLAGVPLRFSYPAKVSGEIGQTGQTVLTDAHGQASLTLPAADFATQSNVVVAVDVSAWQKDLSLVSPADSETPNLESISAQTKLMLPFSVISNATLVPLVVALVDFDDRGRVQRHQVTTSILIDSLRDAGFHVSTVLVNPSLMKSASDRVLLKVWQYQGKTTGRAVYGTVGLVSLTASGSQYVAEVNGTVKVADLESDKALYKKETSVTATGKSRASATSLAYQAWAKQIAQDLSSDLP